MKRLFPTGRYANVTATLALIVALSGTSYAAVKISGKNITNNSISSIKIKNRSLLAADFKKGQLVLARIRTGAPLQVAGGSDGRAVASCRAGERAVNGGMGLNVGNFKVLSDVPVVQGNVTNGPPIGWSVQVENLTTTPQRLDVYVICLRA